CRDEGTGRTLRGIAAREYRATLADVVQRGPDAAGQERDRRSADLAIDVADPARSLARSTRDDQRIRLVGRSGGGVDTADGRDDRPPSDSSAQRGGRAARSSRPAAQDVPRIEAA